MTRKKNKTPYRCGFCRERLSPVKLSGLDVLRLCLLIRTYQCPHCFQCVYRPVSWIARLPIINRLTKCASESHTSSRRDAGLKPLAADFGIFLRIVVAIGRSVSKCERLLTDFVVALFRWIMAVIWFVPALIAKLWNRDDRSDRKFLKPSR